MLQRSQQIYKTSPQGRAFIEGFEECVLYVYDDKVPKRRIDGKVQYPEWRPGMLIHGTLTIGFGHTDDAAYKLPFKLHAVPSGFRISEAQAHEILSVDLSDSEAEVNELVKVPITQGIFDALNSFNFNCGKGNTGKITARLNRGDEKGARAALMNYTRSKGEYMRGLASRRRGEQMLWDSEIVAVPVDVAHHAAEVDQAPASIAELRSDSWQLTTAHLTKLASSATGIGAVGSIFVDAVNQAKGVTDAINTVLDDRVLLMAAGAALVVLLGVGIFEGIRWAGWLNGTWTPRRIAARTGGGGGNGGGGADLSLAATA